MNITSRLHQWDSGPRPKNDKTIPPCLLYLASHLTHHFPELPHGNHVAPISPSFAHFEFRAVRFRCRLPPPVSTFLALEGDTDHMLGLLLMHILSRVGAQFSHPKLTCLLTAHIHIREETWGEMGDNECMRQATTTNEGDRAR